MEVILLERIDQLGQMGDVVKVKAGFARNYLLPQKKALRANKESRAYFESKRSELEATNLERRGEAEAVAKKMDGTKLIIVRQAGEGGQLYGSVTARDIGDALKEAGYTVDRGQVLLHTPVKVLGAFKTAVRLHPEVNVEVECNVARSIEEANLMEKKATEFLERKEDAEKLAQASSEESKADETEGAEEAPDETPPAEETAASDA
jgi:large subunit ribosomal protein L9